MIKLFFPKNHPTNFLFLLVNFKNYPLYHSVDVIEDLFSVVFHQILTLFYLIMIIIFIFHFLINFSHIILVIALPLVFYDYLQVFYNFQFLIFKFHFNFKSFSFLVKFNPVYFQILIIFHLGLKFNFDIILKLGFVREDRFS